MSIALDQLRQVVNQTVSEARITDIHTHLYHPRFGGLLLWGVDELLTYHYLIAETMRWSEIDYETFFSLPKKEQANLVWQKLFLENTPYSEACRGVLTTLSRLGFDLSTRNLDEYRAYFRGMPVEDYVDHVFRLSNLDAVVMTNDPFDPDEVAVWNSGRFQQDSRFHAALRIDPLLNGWERNHKLLREWGYEVDGSLSAGDLGEVRRFLTDWVKRMDPLYMAVSLPATFAYPEESPRAKLIEECVLPVCRGAGIPFAMMIGVKRQVNPGLRLAGDSGGRARISAVEQLCATYPDNKFLVTMLSRENQHELAVTARKFRNLMVFGCWWFMNNPSMVDEITRMRFEMLGVSVIPQHSDARVLDQAIYKWDHSRRIIANVLYDKYADVAATGWQVTGEEIRRDVAKLFGGNFWSFLGRQPVRH